MGIIFSKFFPGAFLLNNQKKTLEGPPLVLALFGKGIRALLASQKKPFFIPKKKPNFFFSFPKKTKKTGGGVGFYFFCGFFWAKGLFIFGDHFFFQFCHRGFNFCPNFLTNFLIFPLGGGGGGGEAAKYKKNYFFFKT